VGKVSYALGFAVSGVDLCRFWLLYSGYRCFFIESWNESLDYKLRKLIRLHLFSAWNWFEFF
jgi:hypothetical protein